MTSLHNLFHRSPPKCPRCIPNTIASAVICTVTCIHIRLCILTEPSWIILSPSVTHALFPRTKMPIKFFRPNQYCRHISESWHHTKWIATCCCFSIDIFVVSSVAEIYQGIPLSHAEIKLQFILGGNIFTDRSALPRSRILHFSRPFSRMPITVIWLSVLLLIVNSAGESILTIANVLTIIAVVPSYNSSGLVMYCRCYYSNEAELLFSITRHLDQCLHVCIFTTGNLFTHAPQIGRYVSWNDL